jgi:hypothetical protein
MWWHRSLKEFSSLARTPGQGHRRDDLTDRTDLRFWPIMADLGSRDVERLLADR